jgi:hypothetical protein
VGQASVDDGAAGTLMGVVFRDDQFIPIQGHYGSTWRGDRNLAGSGTLLEHSIHDVDMLRFLVGEVSTISAHTTNFHGHDGIEDVATATLRFESGALGTLASIWHDNLSRPSLRRVEVFCAHRHIVITGNDWYGPVRWTDTDGASHSLADQELVDAVTSMRDGDGNPDGAFVRCVIDGVAATTRLRRRGRGSPAHRCHVPLGRRRRQHRFDRSRAGRGWLNCRSSRSAAADTYPTARGSAERHAIAGARLRRRRAAGHVPPRVHDGCAWSRSRHGRRGRHRGEPAIQLRAWPPFPTCRAEVSAPCCWKRLRPRRDRSAPRLGPPLATPRSSSI